MKPFAVYDTVKCPRLWHQLTGTVTTHGSRVIIKPFSIISTQVYCCLYLSSCLNCGVIKSLCDLLDRHARRMADKVL